MNCEIYRDAMENLLDGEIDQANAARVNSHVFACADCAARLESLKREKEIFAQYLFAAEPPPDLWRKFQAGLADENKENFAAAKPTAVISNWSFGLFGRAVFYPVAWFGIALVTFGIWWSFQSKSENKDAALNESKNVLSISPTSKNFDAGATSSSAPERIKNAAASPGIKEKRLENTFPTKAKLIESQGKSASIRVAAKQQPIAPRRFKDDSTEIAEVTAAEKARIEQMQTLEIETAKQMEKVEMLLRSFRNARLVEGSRQYDVSFEKRQARKLLEKNIQLRVRAENYGTPFAEQSLSRVEPYLLDIANLETNPLEEQVLEIRERVKNQSIIAGVQGFNGFF